MYLETDIDDTHKFVLLSYNILGTPSWRSMTHLYEVKDNLPDRIHDTDINYGKKSNGDYDYDIFAVPDDKSIDSALLPPPHDSLRGELPPLPPPTGGKRSTGGKRKSNKKLKVTRKKLSRKKK